MSAQGTQGDPAIYLFLVFILLGVLGWVFWHLTGDFWLNYFLRWLRFAELWILDLFTGNYDACLDWLRTAKVNDPAPSAQVIRLTRSCFGTEFLSQVPRDQLISYFQMSSSPITLLGLEAQQYYRWPLSFVLLTIGLYSLLFTPYYKFATKHTLESIIVTQAKMWPVISPIVKINPSKFGRVLGSPVPDKLPIFAEALSPEEWISWNRIPLVNGIPERDAVRRALIQQLGPRWTGDVPSLPLHIRALLAAFVLKGIQKREESDAFLGRLAEAWSPEKGFSPSFELVAEIKKILNDPDRGEKIVPSLNHHAWRTTAVLGALQWARNNGGVLAPAQFLWIRAEDRALWYPLNNLGRRAFHSEGAGAMAHFMAEVSAKKPLPIPRVDTAVVTLNTYLHDPDKRTVAIPPRENA